MCVKYQVSISSFLFHKGHWSLTTNNEQIKNPFPVISHLLNYLLLLLTLLYVSSFILASIVSLESVITKHLLYSNATCGDNAVCLVPGTYG